VDFIQPVVARRNILPVNPDVAIVNSQGIINILNEEIPTESFYSKKGNPKVICNQLQKEVCIKYVYKIFDEILF